MCVRPGAILFLVNDHTRPLCGASETVWERWLLEREESGLASEALLGDIQGRQMNTIYLGRLLLPAG